MPMPVLRRMFGVALIVIGAHFVFQR